MVKARTLWIVAFVFAAIACTRAQNPPQKNWPWPAIPGCLADPEIKTPGTTDYNSPLCSIYDLLLGSSQTDVELISARRLNGRMDGVLYPAFLPGTEAVSFFVSAQFSTTFTGADQLVRVSTSSVSARSGSWWTTLSTVTVGGRLMSAEDIRAKLALTGTPLCIAYADSVRSGVRGYLGVVAPAFDEPGGGAEFWFPPSAVQANTVHAIPGITGCDVP